MSTSDLKQAPRAHDEYSYIYPNMGFTNISTLWDMIENRCVSFSFDQLDVKDRLRHRTVQLRRSNHVNDIYTRGIHL